MNMMINHRQRIALRSPRTVLAHRPCFIAWYLQVLIENQRTVSAGWLG